MNPLVDEWVAKAEGDPGYCAEAQDAAEALEIARRVRRVVRQGFGLPQ